MENIRFLNSYRNIPPSLLREGRDGYEKPEIWEGLKTGLIVAGLNHAMHVVENVTKYFSNDFYRKTKRKCNYFFNSLWGFSDEKKIMPLIYFHTSSDPSHKRIFFV